MSIDGQGNPNKAKLGCYHLKRKQLSNVKLVDHVMWLLDVQDGRKATTVFFLWGESVWVLDCLAR